MFTKYRFNNKVADLQVNKKLHPTLNALHLQSLYIRF